MTRKKYEYCPECNSREPIPAEGFITCSNCRQIFSERQPHYVPRPSTPGITNCGDRKWAVKVPIRRDPETGKMLHYSRVISGAKKDAEAHREWIRGLLARGMTTIATVTQTELRALEALEVKATRYREKLEATVRGGAVVEPGPLSLSPADPRAESELALAARSMK